MIVTLSKAWRINAYIDNLNIYLARAENVVYVLKKSFVLYFVVTEYESDSLALATGSSVQKLEIFDEVRNIVRSNVEHEHIKRWCHANFQL